MTAFLNTVRVNALHDIAEGLKTEGIDITKDLVKGKELADFINTTTGRAPLKSDIPFTSKEVNLERHVKLLNDLMFSPRNSMSNVRMLNPSTYMYASKGVREQYIYSMLRKTAAWGSVLALGKIAGGTVSMDPTNSDFLKLRFGNHRTDSGGGLQQFIVLAARSAPEIMGGGGITSSATRPGQTGKFRPFGEGYKPDTRFSNAINFAVNHAHPTLGAAIQGLNSTDHRPFNPGDATIKMMVPMFASDMKDVLNKNPNLGSVIESLATGFNSSVGLGEATYEKKSQPTWVPF